MRSAPISAIASSAPSSHSMKPSAASATAARGSAGSLSAAFDRLVVRERAEGAGGLARHFGGTADQVVADRDDEILDVGREYGHRSPPEVSEDGSGTGNANTSRAVRQRNHSVSSRPRPTACGFASSTGTLYGRSPPYMTRSGPSRRIIFAMSPA